MEIKNLIIGCDIHNTTLGLKMLKQILVILSNISGLLFISLGLLFILFESSIDNTMKHNSEIDLAFNQANEFIQFYKYENNKLPTSAELKKWPSQFPQSPHTPNGIKIITINMPAEIIQKYGKPKGKLAFVLSYWRGDWSEYYISWENESTIIKNRNKYYWSGNSILEWLIPMSIGILILLLANKNKVAVQIKKLQKSK
jgi:hypothetical protein